MQNPLKIFNKLSDSKRKAVLSFACLFIAWLFFFWPTISLVFYPKTITGITMCMYGIPLATLYLFWEKRKAMEGIFFASSQLGLFALFLMVTVFIVGEVFSLSYVEQSAMLLMLPALMMTAFGPAFVQIFLFPLLYLTLIIPLQDETLANRTLFAWGAVFLFVAYLWYSKRHRPDVLMAGETPSWVSNHARWFMPTTIAFCTLMVAPWLGDNIRAFYPPTHRVIALRAPLGTEGWVGPRPIQGQSIAPLYSNASAILQAEYFRNESSRESIDLYTAYYHSDRGFSEVLENTNLLYDPRVWQQTASGTQEVPMGDKPSVAVLEIILSSAEESRVLWYWFYVAGLGTTDLSLAILLDKVRIISKYAQGSGVIALSAPFATSPEEARKSLSSFLGVMYNALDVLKRPELSYVPRRIQAGT